MTWVIFANYRRRRLELTGRESAETLEHMQGYFQDGANWTQGMYENASGARCLVGAANHVRVSSIDDAKHWLRLAIAEVAPGICAHRGLQRYAPHLCRGRGGDRTRQATRRAERCARSARAGARRGNPAAAAASAAACCPRLVRVCAAAQSRQLDHGLVA